MKIKLSSILALAGITTTFMPWVVYPKADMALYGYVADGIFTGFIFFILLILSLVPVKGKTKTVISYLFLFLSILMCSISYYKIYNFWGSKGNFETDNVMISVATAGYYLSYGVYIMAFISLLLVLNWILEKYSKSTRLESKSKRNFSIGAILMVLFMGAGFLYYNYIPQTTDLSNQEIKTIVEKDLNQMSKALATSDFDTFIGYNHPTFVDMIGGKTKLTEMMIAATDAMAVEKMSIKDITIKEIKQVLHDPKSIQVLFSQNTIYNQNEGLAEDESMMLAISENSGQSWKYIAINDRSKAEMINFFPFLNEQFEF